jgi:hypothetical protein
MSNPNAGCPRARRSSGRPSTRRGTARALAGATGAPIGGVGDFPYAKPPNTWTPAHAVFVAHAAQLTPPEVRAGPPVFSRTALPDGGGVAAWTVQVRVATAPALPAPSVACTWSVCSPAASPSYVVGDAQGAKAPVSSAHARVVRPPPRHGHRSSELLGRPGGPGDLREAPGGALGNA